MSDETSITKHPPEKAKILLHYASLDEARVDQLRFESRSLLGELYAGLGSYGLHFAESGTDVVALLQHGAPINGIKQIDYGDDLQHWETPLLTAYIDGRLEAATSLIGHGASVDAPNLVVLADGAGFGHTALHMLTARADIAGALSLITAGSDVNQQTTEGMTPLHYAAVNDDKRTVDVLLRKGAKPGIRDFSGALPIDVAGKKARHSLS